MYNLHLKCIKFCTFIRFSRVLIGKESASTLNPGTDLSGSGQYILCGQYQGPPTGSEAKVGMIMVKCNQGTEGTFVVVQRVIQEGRITLAELTLVEAECKRAKNVIF